MGDNRSRNAWLCAGVAVYLLSIVMGLDAAGVSVWGYACGVFGGVR
jgi:hypothetical protein